MQTTQIATESGHWYLPDGTPFYECLTADGKKMRPTTLRDARKVGAVPSVTTITKLLAKDGLIRWKLDQMMMAALTITKREQEPEADFIQRIWDESDAKSLKARERGTTVHGDIEKFIQAQKGELAASPHVEQVYTALNGKGIDLLTGDAEKSFAHDMGYGGKVDFHQTGEKACVVDFKTKDNIVAGKKLAYDEHAMQLAAYRIGLNIGHARCLNVFIGIDDCKVEIVEHPEEDLQKGWEMFQLILKLWKLKNNVR